MSKVTVPWFESYAESIGPTPLVRRASTPNGEWEPGS